MCRFVLICIKYESVGYIFGPSEFIFFETEPVTQYQLNNMLTYVEPDLQNFSQKCFR